MTDVSVAVESLIENAIEWPIKITLPVSVFGIKTKIAVTITKSDFEEHADELIKVVRALMNYVTAEKS